jgi:putative transposase
MYLSDRFREIYFTEKMEYNPDKHHRRSIRLKGYDYVRPGLYFITICVKNRECLFGEIGNAQMFLNDAGRMVEKWYRELANRFPDKKCRQMVIMPNHLHCIIENTITETPVGTDLRVCPGILPGNRQLSGKYKISGNHISLGEHAGSPLHRAVQWFKTMTTNAYIHGVKKTGRLSIKNCGNAIIKNTSFAMNNRI